MPDDRVNRILKLTDSIPGVVYQLVVRPDNSWHFAFVSKGAEELFGVTPEDACRDAEILTRCIVEEDRTAHRESIRIATNNLQPRFYEFRILTTNGQLKWGRGRALPEKQPDGSVIWSGMLVDVTEQKTLEAAFRNAQKTAATADTIISNQLQLRTIIEAMPDAVFFKDGQGLWQITNKVAIDLFGLQDVPWKGKSEKDLMLLRPEHRKTFEVCIKSDECAWKAGKAFYTEETVFSQDHQPSYLSMSKVPLFNEDGSRKGLVVIGRDITSQKQMEDKLWNYSLHTEEMIEKERASIARDLHDDLGQTMAALSFEVKRLQNLVSGAVPAAKECIDTLFEYIDSMTTSIHRIRTTLKPLLLEESGLIVSIELLAEQLSNKSGLQIDFDCPCLLCRCIEEPIHVFKIVHEALNNCLKHSRATHITIACVKLPGECLLEISDNGIGFVHPDTVTIKSFGLAGMKERADLLGARLDMRSVVNKGTLVSIYVPCKKEHGGHGCDFS